MLLFFQFFFLIYMFNNEIGNHCIDAHLTVDGGAVAK